MTARTYAADVIPDPTPNPLMGIGLKILSVFLFVAMQTAIKGTDSELPPGQVVFFRSFFALFPVSLYLVYRGEFRTAIQTDDLVGHFIRGLVGVISMGLGFFALGHLPYPEWVAISYAAPLLTVVLAAVLLREVVRGYRWAAVLVGLVGVLVVVAPSMTIGSGSELGRGHAIGALAALGGAGATALAMIQIRRLVRVEKTVTIVVYFSVTCTLLSLVTIPFGWVWPTGQQLAIMAAAGLFGGIGQLLLTACYRHADASTIAPFEYTSMILAIAVGYFVFGEQAAVTTLIGAVIVISAGVFIILREHRKGLERNKARGASSPNG